MSALAASIVTALVTAVVAVGVTYATTRRNLAVQYDSQLRDLRIKAYTELWKHMEALAKYGRPGPISRERVRRLCRQLATWYFNEGGGMYLSDATRRDYFALQDGLELLERRSDPPEPTKEDDEFIRVLASRLRTGLVRDIGTRKTFMLRSDVEPAPRLREVQTLYSGGRKIQVRVRQRFDLGKPLRRLGSWIRRTTSSEAVEISKWDGDKWNEIKATWQPDRRGIETEHLSDAAGTRLALYEGQELLEGPTGWSRLDETVPPLQVRVWRPRPPAKSDTSDTGDNPNDSDSRDSSGPTASGPS